MQFVELLRASQSPDLAEMALQVSRIEYPDLEIAPYLQQLDDIAEQAQRLAGASASVLDLIDAINQHLFAELGFKGNDEDYYDPRNSFLNEVIDRRTGIPITLGIVYLSVARRLAVAVNGVSFPGHFLLRVELTAQPLILDPFNAGRILVNDDLVKMLDAAGAAGSKVSLEQSLAATANTDVISRVLRNLKGIYVQREDAVKTLPIVEHLLALHPNSPSELRDRGYLFQALECFGAARADFERYLELSPYAKDGEQIRARCRMLTNDSAKQLH
jgi:regulator of sirC expression with transglutaminase-like and TPR domain